ncbi:MAG: RDD family protein [Gemmatimonadetes bacterium]|nr:RDD family protein [Gemmatimonadota bacterium]
MTYARFWKRFAAAIVDVLITGTFAGIYAALGAWFYNFGMDTAGSYFAGDALFLTVMIGFLICYLSIDWLYYAIMESSSLQATLGKLAVGIAVTDLKGNRISFARASGRHFAKMISRMTAYFGYVMAAFTERKQTLHDMMAGCIIVNKEDREVE